MRNCASALMRPPVHHQMPITIFYSWQLDLPAEVGKQFIHDALVAAVNRVAGDLKLEEAERPVVDHDTKDVLGDPKIIDIILEKIRAADVVVFDTTLTGRTVDGKKSVINSNVAYELGHAHQMHGHGVVLKVMNTFYGAAKRLPFDIQERRHPVTFTLDPKADAAAREKVLQDFVGELADILAQYVKARTPPPAPFERTPSNGNPAVYWRDGDPLVDLGRRQLTAPVTAPMVYLRLSPGTALPPFTGIQIADRVFTHARPLIGEAVPHSNSRNDYGMIHWFRPETRRDDGEDLPDLFAWTQVFRNREIWGINAMHLHAVWNQQIVMDHVERTLIDGLQDYLTKAEAFDYPASVHFEAGIVYVRGMRVSLANGGLRSEPLREHFISHEARFDRRDPAAAKAALLALFDRIFDEAAQHRPKNLGGFPGV